MLTFTNISSLNECLDQCALLNFRVSQAIFSAFACTGVAFGIEAMGQQGQQEGITPLQLCYLKNNVTLGTPNGTATNPGFHGAVFLDFEGLVHDSI